MAYWKLSMGAAVAWALGTSGTLAQLNPEQIQMIKETAVSICNTVKEAKGQKSEIQIQGDVNAKLGGLIGKVADIGGSGKGALTREEFEGLSRDATATALQGDRDCRERLFNKMFDKLDAAPDTRRPPSISGRWRDNLGFVSEIEQTGTSFTFTVQGGTSCLFQPFRSTGEGSIRGQDIKSTYRSSIGSHGDCEGIISSDRYTISSRCRDSVCGTSNLLRINSNNAPQYAQQFSLKYEKLQGVVPPDIITTPICAFAAVLRFEGCCDRARSAVV